MPRFRQTAISALFLSLSFYTSRAQAEYRAFELNLSDPASGLDRTEVSTLDPVQYVQFHPVPLTTKVIYKATWMCRGNTSDQDICPNPKAKP